MIVKGVIRSSNDTGDRYARILAAAIVIEVAPAGRERDALQPWIKAWRTGILCKSRDQLSVDELVDALWPLRKWLLQYTNRCDSATFMENMRAMLAALGENGDIKKFGCTVAFDEVSDAFWQAAQSEVAVDDDILDEPTSILAALPMPKPPGWRLARKHLSRLVSRVQRVLSRETVAPPGLTWSALKDIFIKNRWGDLSSKPFGLRRDISLLEVLYGMGIVELWYIEHARLVDACYCGEFNAQAYYVPRHELCVRGLRDSAAKLAGPCITLKRSIDKIAWEGTLDTGVTGGWRLPLRRLSGAVMEAPVHDDTSVADIRLSVSRFLGVLQERIVLHVGDRIARDADRADDFRGGDLHVHVASLKRRLVPGSWASLSHGSPATSKSGESVIIAESQLLCVEEVDIDSNTAKVIVSKPKHLSTDSASEDSSEEEEQKEVSCPWDALVPALVPPLRALQVVPYCRENPALIVRFTSPGVGPHTSAGIEKDYYRGWDAVSPIGHTFLPGSEVVVRISSHTSGDAGRGLCFSARDQSRAKIMHCNVLGLFDACFHQLEVQSLYSGSEKIKRRCVGLPADPEETARVLSELRMLAEQAGLPPRNIRLPAAFIPGFTHGQHVQRAASSQQGCITSSHGATKMYEMRQQGWSATHMELQLPS